MIAHMVCIDEATMVVEFGIDVDNPEDGPVRPIIPAPEGKRFEVVDEPFARLDVPATTLPHLVEGKVRWVETASLDDLRIRKAMEMSQSCADAILAGFVSSALGAAHTYPAKLTDQANL